MKCIWEYINPSRKINPILIKLSGHQKNVTELGERGKWSFWILKKEIECSCIPASPKPFIPHSLVAVLPFSVVWITILTFLYLSLLYCYVAYKLSIGLPKVVIYTSWLKNLKLCSSQALVAHACNPSSSEIRRIAV
jgi:hypothetical protein